MKKRNAFKVSQQRSKVAAPAEWKTKAPAFSSIVPAKKRKQVTASKMVSQKWGASAKGGNGRRQMILVANGKM